MAKRGRKPTKEKNGYYFHEPEEEAIVRYINSDDKDEKNRIYNETLMPAFDKMINSIIRRYKLYVPDEVHQQTFDDTLSYLLTKVGNFKPEKGKKAYSYCGTVAKNYLISKLTTLSKQQQRVLPFNDIMEEANNGFDYDEMYDTETEDIATKLVASISKEIRDMINNAEQYSLNENEIKTGLALCELLENWEKVLDIDNDNTSNKFRKSRVLLFLKEETMMTTKELRDNMRKYKKAYEILKENMVK